MKKNLYIVFAVALMHTSINSQTSFNVKTEDGRIVTSAEWINSTDDYGERIRRQIKPLIVYIQKESTVTPCEVKINQSEEGKIENIQITKASSDPTWCLAVTKAIEKSEFLPLPKVGKSFKTVVINFNP